MLGIFLRREKEKESVFPGKIVMSQALTNDGSDVISRPITFTETCNEFDERNCLDAFRVIDTASWIVDRHFRQIGLQFPDDLLHVSSVICRSLSSLTGQFCFILGDSSFAGCCVDEVAGTRFQIDALVHYGRACLSKLSGTIPVLYVFGNLALKRELDPEPLVSLMGSLLSVCTQEKKSSGHIPLLITYDFRCRDWALAVMNILTTYQQSSLSLRFAFLWSEPDLCPPAVNLPERNTSDRVWCSDSILHRAGRTFHSLTAQQTGNLLQTKPWCLIHLGCSGLFTTQTADTFTLYRILLSLPEVALDQAFCLDTEQFSLNPVQRQMQQLLRRRSYLIEKAKDAHRIGILMGTLSVDGHQLIVDRIQRLLRRAGRFCVTLVVGRLNEAKLANLPELDLLVLIACPEASLLDSRDLLVPVITPFELECALAISDNEMALSARSWTGEKWWLDFRELLPGGACYQSESEVVPGRPESKNSCADVTGDVSLITGKLRMLTRPSDQETISTEKEEQSCLVPRGDWTLMESEVIRSRQVRTWFGLDPSLGQHEVSRLKTGRSGVPTHYDSEQTLD
ncbi:Diphthamide biosynthesis protein 2 [Fasciola gigantica]|uniref:Diphthamide biosynthesis protein 2 n=1 Tax=Fasciola gigantica TaxID=46835 RepID=A0A504Y7N4_FASGI|nr:Diphthamide biosynthesis protein 2 [Fasciola gigantica]